MNSKVVFITANDLECCAAVYKLTVTPAGL